MAFLELTTFYKRCGLENGLHLSFSETQRKDAQKLFVCQCICSEASKGDLVLEKQTFKGEASKKKVAQAEAIAQAAEYIKAQPIFEASKPQKLFGKSLWETLRAAVSDLALQRDVETEGYVLLAEAFNEGWLSLPMLLVSSRSSVLQQWCREYLPDAKQALEQPWSLIPTLWTCMRNEMPPVDVLDSIEIDVGQQLLRRRQRYNAAQHAAAPRVALAAGEVREARVTGRVLRASLDLAAGQRLPAVVVPAEPREEAKEVEVAAGGWYLGELARVLGGPVSCLWSWGTVGRNVRLPSHPAHPPPPGPSLIQRLEEMLVRDFEYPTAEELQAWQEEKSTAKAAQRSTAAPAAAAKDTDAAADLTIAANHVPQPAATLRDSRQISGNLVSISRVGDPPPADAPPLWMTAAGLPEWPAALISHPAMYSMQPEGTGGGPLPWNARASWIAGRTVVGDVVLARMRLRPSSGRIRPGSAGSTYLQVHPLVRHAPYPAHEFWQLASAFSPVSLLAATRGGPSLTRLPTRHVVLAGRVAQQQLQAPAAALQAMCNAGVCGMHAKAALLTSVEAVPANSNGQNGGTDAGGQAAGFVCRAAVPLLGGQPDLQAVSRYMSTKDDAENDAAVKVLHLLQRRYMTLFNPAGLEDNAVASVMRDTVVNVVEPGRGTWKAFQPGTVLRVNYQVVSEGDVQPLPAADQHQAPPAAAHILESQEGFAFEWGSGGVMPEVEAVVGRMSLGGRGHCTVRLAVGGQDLVGHGNALCLDCSLHLHLAAIANPRPQPAGRMFVPALSQQRHEYAASLLRQIGATTLLDLGCGEAALLAHLIRQADAAAAATAATAATFTRLGAASDASVASAASLHDTIQDGNGSAKGAQTLEAVAVTALSAIDVSDVIMTRAKKNLEACLVAARRRPCTQLLQADFCQPAARDPRWWGGLAGCEVATLVEVIEHLDPALLAALGPCLLGGLQPRLLIVTTPNAEYNGVVGLLGGGLLHNGLRNCDHRFEWDRAQFQAWAIRLAAQHCYAVAFDEVGRAVEEAQAKALLGIAGRDVGAAVQVAVFSKLAPCRTPRPAQTAMDDSDAAAVPVNRRMVM